MELAASGVPDAGADHVEEVALDPFTCEVIREADRKLVAVEIDAADPAEPGLVGAVVERFSQSSRNVLPEACCRQLDLPLHVALPLLHSTPGSGEHTNALATAQ